MTKEAEKIFSCITALKGGVTLVSKEYVEKIEKALKDNNGKRLKSRFDKGTGVYELALVEENPKERINYEAVLAQFKVICTELPQPKALNDGRRRAIRNCKAQLDRQGMTFEEFFKKVADSDFLCRMSSGRTWKADIDFILRPAQVIKIIEGGYDNRRAPAKKGPGVISRESKFDLKKIIADAKNNVTIKGL